MGDHAGIRGVHGDLCRIVLLEKGSVSGMVEIPVGEQDQLQAAGLYAALRQRCRYGRNPRG